MSQPLVSVGKVFAAAVAVSLSALAVMPSTATAAVVSIANPGGSGEIGARIRWGGTGWEAGIRSSVHCPGASPNLCGAPLNPVGTPVWALNEDHAFKVEYKTDGTLSLGVDFNRSNGIEASEMITFGFGALNLKGFDYLQIFGNDGSGSAESQVSNLMINGTLIGTLASGGAASTDTFYNDTSGGATAWLITGNLKFLTAGTAQENPSWNFNFRSSGTPDANPVPVPGTLALGGLALLALGAAGRRKSA